MRKVITGLLISLGLLTAHGAHASDIAPHYLISEGIVYLSDAIGGRLHIGSFEKARLNNMLERNDAFSGVRPSGPIPPAAPKVSQPKFPTVQAPVAPKQQTTHMPPRVTPSVTSTSDYYSGPVYSW